MALSGKTRTINRDEFMEEMVRKYGDPNDKNKKKNFSEKELEYFFKFHRLKRRKMFNEWNGVE